MNEQNAKTHNPENLQDIALIDLNQLLTSCLPRMDLLPLVKERVKLAIAHFVRRAPISESRDEAMASADLVDYLRCVRSIPLPLELCTLMARVGFDEALLTYGHADGRPVGYAEAEWLLKFVELAEKEPSRYQEASWLRFFEGGASRH